MIVNFNIKETEAASFLLYNDHIEVFFMYNFVLLDDVKEHNGCLSQMLQTICREEAINAHVALETVDRSEVLKYAESARVATVYFLDIELGVGEKGIDICRKIQAMHHDSYFIYVSAYTHFAIECFHSHASDFLPKPFSKEELRQCILGVLRDIQRHYGHPSLSIRIGSRVFYVPVREVQYFSSFGKNVTAHTADARHTWRGSLSKVHETLDQARFLRIHRNHVVHLDHVRLYDQDAEQVHMTSGDILPVSRRLKTGLLQTQAERTQNL